MEYYDYAIWGDRIELFHVLTHNEFEFRYNVELDIIEYKSKEAKEWVIVTNKFLHILLDLMRVDGYVYTIDHITSILKGGAPIKE